MNQIATDNGPASSEDPIVGTGRLTHSQHLDQFLSYELRDLHLLESEVAPFYSPTKNPWAMVIGASSIREATIIREFHSAKFQISPADVTVVGCTTVTYPTDFTFKGDFDLTLTGRTYGNAIHEFTWMHPFMELGGDRAAFDFTYIRNPDLVMVSDWAGVYARAVEFTRPEGAVVTLIRRDDTDKYDQLLSILEDRYKIKPVLSKTSGIQDPNDPLFQHHTIGIFKAD